jgi:hypothetical protein
VHRTRNFEQSPLRRDHGVDHPCRDFVERAPSQRLAIGSDRSGHLHEIALKHGPNERLSVGEVLIERADRHARPFRGAGRGELAVADRQQNLNARFVNREHGRFRTRLNR